eukprot:207700_1
MSQTQPLLQHEEIKLQHVNDQHTNLSTLQTSINGPNTVTLINNNEYKPHTQNTGFGMSSQAHINVLNKILGRNFCTILFCMLLFASIGVLIYLYTSIYDFVTIFGIIGLLVGIFIESKNRNTKQLFKPIGTYKQLTTKDLDNLWAKHLENEIKEKYSLYYKSDFYDFEMTKLRYKQNGSNRVYIERNNPHTLIVEKRHFKDWIHYLGFESGGGLGIFIAWALYWILLYMRITGYLFIGETNVFKGDFNWQKYVSNFSYMFNLNYLIVAFVMSIIFAVCFALIEGAGRKWNYIASECNTVTVSYFIPLHRINGVICQSVGIEAINFWQFKNFFIYLFKIYCFIFGFIFWGIPKCIYWIITRNVPLFLWILVSGCVTMLFKIKIDHNAYFLGECIVVSVVAMILCIFCVWFVAPCNKQRVCRFLCCKCKPLQYDRINVNTQLCMFLVLLILLILLCGCMVLITDATVKIHADNHSNNGTHIVFDEWKMSQNTWDQFVCSEERGTRHILAQTDSIVIDTNITTNMFDYMDENDRNEQLCSNEEIYSLLTVSLLILCIVWYALLVIMFIWCNKDKYKYEWAGPRAEFDPIEYSYIYLYVKPQGFLAKSLSGFWNFEYYRIELTTEQSRGFLDYLNQNVPFFQQEKPLVHAMETFHELNVENDK